MKYNKKSFLIPTLLFILSIVIGSFVFHLEHKSQTRYFKSEYNNLTDHIKGLEKQKKKQQERFEELFKKHNNDKNIKRQGDSVVKRIQYQIEKITKVRMENRKRYNKSIENLKRYTLISVSGISVAIFLLTYLLGRFVIKKKYFEFIKERVNLKYILLFLSPILAIIGLFAVLNGEGITGVFFGVLFSGTMISYSILRRDQSN